MKILATAKRVFDHIIYFCTVLSTIAIVVIMFAVVLDVSLRWFKIPIYGVFELTGLLVGINIYLGLALTQKYRQHISVTFLSENLSKRARHVIMIPLLTMCVLFFGWLSYLYGQKAYEALITGEVIVGYIQFPVFPLKLTMFLGISLLTIQIFIDILNEVKNLFLSYSKESSDASSPEKAEVQGL